MRVRFVVLVAGVFLAPAAFGAEYVELRQAASVYAEPSKRSSVLAMLTPTKPQPLLLELASTDRSHGYYLVYLPAIRQTGWVYKTYVRRHPGPEPRYVPYRRSLYRHWIDTDRDCQDTRQEVLIRDAAGEVRFKPPRRCDVVRGTWRDPYTGGIIHEPRQLDIDHVVPLKNAHESGAWAWSAARREQYANHLDNRRHLLAVKGSENRRKGDKGPDRYLPPEAAFQCDYVRTWVKIKSDWQLSMTAPERMTVEQILSRCPQ
jgi:hypothetical protein